MGEEMFSVFESSVRGDLERAAEVLNNAGISWKGTPSGSILVGMEDYIVADTLLEMEEDLYSDWDEILPYE